MFHYSNAITNTKGDALIGYYVKAIDTSSGEVVSLYADESATPIVSVSGLADACLVDSDGMASFYIEGGQYHLDIYATDGATRVRRIPNIPMVDFTVAAGNVASRALLAAKTGMANGDSFSLVEKGREGAFVFDSSDLSDEVSADTLQGIYVAPSSDTTGASGAWVRANRDTISAFWYMSAAQVADVRAFTYTLNVTDALNAAATAVQDNGGGTLVLPPGGYLVGQQERNGTLLDQPLTSAAWAPSHIITIRDCTKPLRLSGYGAVLKAEDGLHFGSFDPATGDRYDPGALPFLDYDYYGSPYRGMLYLRDNDAVVVEGFELDGNNTQYVLGGYFGDSTWQNEASGISAQANASLVVRDCHIHHHGQDGIGMRGDVATEGSAPTPILIENCKLRYNGRLGASHVGGKNVTFINCDLSMNGQALNTVSDEVVQATPGSGVDIEAEQGVIRNMQFINCTMVSNWVTGVTAASGDSRGVSFDRCKIEGAIIGRPDYTFTDCTIIGKIDVGIALSDQYRANSTGASLTIAGSGPYTITRSAGSFVTDGHEVGATVILPSAFGGSAANGSLNSANKDKRLLVSSVTATVLTVTVVGGGTLTAEGPIASCTVATATTNKDSQVFRKCRLVYDASLTETVTLTDDDQSRLADFLWGRLEGCEIDTGAVALPNINIPGAGEAQPHISNCRFKSTAATAVNLYARYQGYNYIDYGATPGFDFGNSSFIETGDVIVNGTGQATAAGITDGDYGDVVFSSSGTVAKVESASAPTSGNFVVSGNASATDMSLHLNNPVQNHLNTISFQYGGLNRWAVGYNSDSEFGGDNGAKFQINRYSDGGSYLGTALEINRATGNAVFSGGITGQALAGTSLTLSSSLSGATSIASTGAITSSGGKIGYATGAGSTVTQATSKSTGVTLNKVTGQVTMHNASLAAGTPVSFTLTNSTIAATDTVTVNIASGATANSYVVCVTAVAAGSCRIQISNISAGALGEALVLNYTVNGGASS